MRAWRDRGAAAAALGGYLLLTLALTYPLASNFARAIPGDGFDGWQNYWNLWWVKVALLEQHASPFFTNLLYHPTGVGLLFHTLNPFNGLLTLPIQTAFSLFPAYNTAVLCGFVLGGLGAYLLARQALGPGSSRLAAFGAGAIFTFAPVHIAHLLGHMQVISLEWIPFFALYLLRATMKMSLRGASFAPKQSPPAQGIASAQTTGLAMTVRRPSSEQKTSRRDILLAAFFLILVALCDWYFVLYCLVFSAVVGAWIVLTARPARRALGGLLAIAAVWLIWGAALSPLLWPMVREASQFRFMVPDPAHSRVLSADLLAFVTPHGFHPLWGGWAREQSQVFTSSISEFTVFAGYTVLALAALGMIVRPGTASRPMETSLRGAGFAPKQSPPMQGIASAQTTGLAMTSRRSFPGRPGFWLLALIIFFILSLGPVLHIGGRTALLPGGGEIPLPYGWLARTIPFMEITRSVSRYDIMVMLVLAVLAGRGLDWLWRRGDGETRKQGNKEMRRRGDKETRRQGDKETRKQGDEETRRRGNKETRRQGDKETRWRRGVALAACIAVIFEFLPAPYPMSRPDTPAWYGTLAADGRAGAVLNLPMNWDRPGYLLYQTIHGKPLTAAYISREDPRTLVERAPVLQHFRHLGPDIIAFALAGQGQQALAELGVRWVALDRYKMPGGKERGVTEAAAGQIFGSQPPVYRDDRLTVYEVTPPAQRAAYLILGAGWGPLAAEARTRAFTDSAEVLVQSPIGGAATLRVTLAAGSPLLAAPAVGDAFALPVTLQPGSNTVILRSQPAGQRVVVKELALAP
jgi:hypothetical protein